MTNQHRTNTQRERAFDDLTDQQAAGVACVVCGADIPVDADRTESVGIALTTESHVFACPRMCLAIATGGA